MVMAKKAVALADRARGAFQMRLNSRNSEPMRSTPPVNGTRRRLCSPMRSGGSGIMRPQNPLLYSLQGSQYCDLLLPRNGAGERRADRGPRRTI